MHAYVDSAMRLDAEDRHARLVDAWFARADDKHFEKHRRSVLDVAGKGAAKPKRDPNRVSLAEQARRRKAKV